MKNLMKLEENLTVTNTLKAIHKDNTPTLTKALILFCERARSVKPHVPITVESVSAKAKNIVAKMIVEYERNMTIMEAEDVDALKLHLFSSTWSFKLLKPHNVKIWSHPMKNQRVV